jgi:hypothetical protein
MNTLAARINIATNYENFWKVLEKYNINTIDFVFKCDECKSVADLPPQYQEAIQAGIDQYLEEVY